MLFADTPREAVTETGTIKMVVFTPYKDGNADVQQGAA